MLPRRSPPFDSRRGASRLLRSVGGGGLCGGGAVRARPARPMLRFLLRAGMGHFDAISGNLGKLTHHVTNIALVVGSVLGGITILGVTALVLLQNKLIYVPLLPGQPRGYAYTPHQVKLAGEPLLYEDVWLTAADGVRVHAWLVRAPQRPALRGPTVIFFQENAGNIGLRLVNVVELLRHVDCNVLLLSYRGYGDSEGKPSEGGIKLDAKARPQRRGGGGRGHLLWCCARP